MSEQKSIGGDNVYAATEWADNRYKVTCKKELGEWTVRIGGNYVQSFALQFPFYNEDKPAREAAELALRLRDILGRH